MSAWSLDLPAYLDRIGVRAGVAPTVSTLRALHWAHLLAVPFENLDIVPLGRAIRLDPPALEAKIVRRRRGGFCYELNGLFAAALEAIGFGVSIVSVRFIAGDGGLGPAFDHMALLVAVPGDADRFLADVGAGGTSPAFPLRLRDGFAEWQGETGSAYRLQRRGEQWQLHRREEGAKGWVPDYAFSEEARRREQFGDRCRFQETAPDSHFTQGPLCSRNTPGGRITLSKDRLITTANGERHERALHGDAEFRAALREHFGIDLDVPI